MCTRYIIADLDSNENTLMKFLSKIKGQGLVEYALILVLVAVVVIVILAQLGPATGNVFSAIVELFEYDPENPESPPPECYGSFLLSIMVGGMGTVVAISYWLSKDVTEEFNAVVLDE